MARYIIMTFAENIVPLEPVNTSVRGTRGVEENKRGKKVVMGYNASKESILSVTKTDVKQIMKGEFF